MRFYRIDITDQNTGKPIYLQSLKQPLSSLLPNGITNPGALTIALDVPVYPGHVGDTKSYVRIWGVGLQDIGQAMDLNGKNIVVHAGMAKGLPLANPQQAGLLVQGGIIQAYGNWIGTEQTLDLLIGPPTGSPSAPQNFTFTWQAGTPLSVAIGNTLRSALPGMKQQISISANLVLGYTETGYYESLRQFAGWVNQRTIPLLGAGSQGVQIGVRGDTVVVWDGTVAPPSIKKIAPQDLIGQPTWSQPGEVTFQTVMRADIGLQDVISLPPTIITQTSSSWLRFQDRTSFTGNFTVQRIHHFGSYRQPEAASWNTTFFANPQLK